MKIKHLYKDIITETQIIQEYSFILGEVVRLCEDESYTFEWDLTKEKLDKSRSKITTKDQAIKYLEFLMDKVKNLPEKIKIKIIKYSSYVLVGLIGLNTINSIITDKEPNIKDEIVTTKETTIHKSPKKVSKNLLNLLKYEEGSIKQKGEPVLKAYKLGDGAITVGWGHAEPINNSHFKDGQVISRKLAERLFREDVLTAQDGLNRILRDWEKQKIPFNITQDMYDSMTSMIYNMGIGNFRGSDFIQLVKLGKYEQAKERILTTNVTYPGHIPRRQKESDMFGGNLGGELLTMNESNDFDWVGDIQPMKPEMEFLKDNFDNLEKVINGDQIYYVDSERNPLFVYYQDSENGFVYINYDRIWSILEEDFDLNYTEIQELIKVWLGETYNLRGFTPKRFVI